MGLKDILIKDPESGKTRELEASDLYRILATMQDFIDRWPDNKKGIQDWQTLSFVIGMLYGGYGRMQAELEEACTYAFFAGIYDGNLEKMQPFQDWKKQRDQDAQHNLDLVLEDLRISEPGKL